MLNYSCFKLAKFCQPHFLCLWVNVHIDKFSFQSGSFFLLKWPWYPCYFSPTLIQWVSSTGWFWNNPLCLYAWQYNYHFPQQSSQEADSIPSYGPASVFILHSDFQKARKKWNLYKMSLAIIAWGRAVRKALFIPG